MMTKMMKINKLKKRWNWLLRINMEKDDESNENDDNDVKDESDVK